MPPVARRGMPFYMEFSWPSLTCTKGWGCKGQSPFHLAGHLQATLEAST